MEMKRAAAVVAIIAIVSVTAGVIGWLYGNAFVAEPTPQESVPSAGMTRPAAQSDLQAVSGPLHTVFTREADGGNHVIYDGRDLGEASESWPVISENHVAFTRSVDGKDHVIYDGNDVGEGKRIDLGGGNITFIREVDGKPHVIHNGTDYGEVMSGQDYQYAVYDDTVVLIRRVGGKPHLFVGGQDQGEVSSDFRVGSGGVAFLRNIGGKNHVVFDGKDYGEAWQLEGVSAGHVFYSKQGEPVDNGSWYNDFFRDGEFLGSGQNITISDDGLHYAIQKQIALGKESYENRVLYDGRDVGRLGDTLNIFMSGDHFAYYRDIDGAQHVIYDGEDAGVGDNISLSGDRVAFARRVGAEWHVIYDGKDIGIGSYPRISGDDIVIQRLVDGAAHLFLNEADLGTCGSRAFGTQTDDCWPELSR